MMLYRAYHFFQGQYLLAQDITCLWALGRAVARQGQYVLFRGPGDCSDIVQPLWPGDWPEEMRVGDLPETDLRPYWRAMERAAPGRGAGAGGGR